VGQGGVHLRGQVIINHTYVINEEFMSENYQAKKLNTGSILAVLCGALVGLLVPWGVAPLNALVVSGVICYISEYIARSKVTE